MPFRSLVATAVAAGQSASRARRGNFAGRVFPPSRATLGGRGVFSAGPFSGRLLLWRERGGPRGLSPESACSDHQRAAWRAMTPVRATEQTRWAEARLRTSKRREGGRGAEEGTGTCTEENVSSNAVKFSVRNLLRGEVGDEGALGMTL